MGTNTISTRATKQIVQAVDVNQYYTALTDDFIPRVFGTGLPLSNWGSIGNSTYKWASGVFSGNVEAGGFSIGGIPVGTSTDTYWSAVGTNISYLGGKTKFLLDNNSDVASVSNVGGLRYRESGDNSYIDCCMKTGASSYEWVEILRNSW